MSPYTICFAKRDWFVLRALKIWLKRFYIVPNIRCFFRHFYVRWIVQESSIYHRVEGSSLYQNPLSVNSAKFSLPTILLYSFQSLIFWSIKSFTRKKNRKLKKIKFHFTTTRLNAVMGIQMLGSIGQKACVATMNIGWCTLLTLYTVISENCRTTSQSGFIPNI